MNSLFIVAPAISGATPQFDDVVSSGRRLWSLLLWQMGVRRATSFLDEFWRSSDRRQRRMEKMWKRSTLPDGTGFFFSSSFTLNRVDDPWTTGDTGAGPIFPDTLAKDTPKWRRRVDASLEKHLAPPADHFRPAILPRILQSSEILQAAGFPRIQISIKAGS